MANATKEKGIEYQKKHYKKKPEYYKQKSKERRQRLRLFIHTIKFNSSCKDCGEDHFAVLDFHHRNNEEKKFDIGAAVGWGYSEKRILEEIAKCDVLCANCHRLHHYFDPIYKNTDIVR